MRQRRTMLIGAAFAVALAAGQALAAGGSSQGQSETGTSGEMRSGDKSSSQGTSGQQDDASKQQETQGTSGQMEQGDSKAGQSDQTQGTSGSQAPGTPPSQSGQAESPTQGTSGQVDQQQQEALKSYLGKVQVINKAEISAGELAQQRANGEDARALAKTLSTDHRQAQQQVDALAQKLGISLEGEMPTDVKELESKLKESEDRIKQAKGEAFDETFAREMQAGHQEAISLVEKSQEQFKDQQDVQAFNKEFLPTLQEHQELAAKVLEKAKASQAGEHQEQPAAVGE